MHNREHKDLVVSRDFPVRKVKEEQLDLKERGEKPVFQGFR